MKHLGNFLLGLALAIVGVVIFLQNISVTGFSLYQHSGVNIGAIIICLAAISFIVMLVKTNIFTILIFAAIAIVFIITMILSVQFRIKQMSALALVLIIGLVCVGIAFVIKGLIGLMKNDEV